MERFERQPGAQAELIHEVHLLYEASLSRLREIAVLPNAPKTNTVKENKQVGEYIPNKKRTR